MGGFVQALGGLGQDYGEAFEKQREADFKQQALDIQRQSLAKQYAALTALNNYRGAQIGLGQQRVNTGNARVGEGYRKFGLVPNQNFDPEQEESPTNQRYVPVTPDQMTPAEQAKLAADKMKPQLMQAQSDLAKARTDYLMNPDNPTYKLRYMQLQTAMGNLKQKWANLALSQDRFDRDTFGTYRGQAIPGSAENPDAPGTPVGWHNPTLNPTSQTKQRGQTADIILNHFPDVRAQIADLAEKGKLGPLVGRSEEFMAGKVGAGDPDYAKLRTTLHLLDTALMQAHTGSRGSNLILNEFLGLLNAGGMDADTLNASLNGIQPFLEGYVQAGRGKAMTRPAVPASLQNAVTPPAASTIRTVTPQDIQAYADAAKIPYSQALTVFSNPKKYKIAGK